MIGNEVLKSDSPNPRSNHFVEGPGENPISESLSKSAPPELSQPKAPDYQCARPASLNEFYAPQGEGRCVKNLPDKECKKFDLGQEIQPPFFILGQEILRSDSDDRTRDNSTYVGTFV
ncbi:hypothetical protein ACJJTC_008767 [Scirpophaga incertulas]